MQVSFQYGKSISSLEVRPDLVAVYDRRLAWSASTESSARIALRDDLRSLLEEPISAVDEVRPVFATAGYELGRPRTDSASLSRLSTVGVRQVFRTESRKTFIDSGRLIARARPGVGQSEHLNRLTQDGLRPLRRVPVGGIVWEAERVGDDPGFARLVALQSSGRYQYIEPSLIEHIGPRCLPNDPLHLEPWHLQNAGHCGGVAGADVAAEAAWAHTRGLKADGSPVRIAVIDNGFGVTHPDLEAKWLHGGHFVADNVLVPRVPGNFFPDDSHGTKCAGMIVSSGKRIGLAPDARVIPMACLFDQVGEQLTLADAISFAAFPSEIGTGLDDAADGAEVISCSLGSGDAEWLMSQTLADAIDRTTREGRGGLGTVIVWAVCNGPFDIALDRVTSDDRVLAVGRSSREDRDEGSAEGEELDLLAPGTDVVSTASGPHPYEVVTGTSFAAPLVAAACGLVLARFPALTWMQVHERITQGCKQIGGVPYDPATKQHPRFGFGRLDAGEAVK